MSRRFSLLTIVSVVSLLGWNSSTVHAQTRDEARAFFTEFDDHTLHQRGEFVNKIYGPNAADRIRLGRDIFDGFSTAASGGIRIGILDAHGKAVPAADRDAANMAFMNLQTNGALQRLSDLQLGVVKKHFNAGGNIDFDKLQRAVEMFANGELRARAGGETRSNEMDQMFQWAVWKKFAEVAISKNVNRADWEKVLKSLQAGFEIHRTAYPARAEIAGNDVPFFGELTRSTPAQFDMTKALTDAQKTALRNNIQGLTTAQVLTRQSDFIKMLTPGAATAALQPRDVQFASATLNPMFGGYDVSLSVHITDDQGMPAPNDHVAMSIYGGGIILEPDSFFMSGNAQSNSDGTYQFSFFWPALSVDSVGFWAQAFDVDASALGAIGVVVPEPNSLLFVAATFLGLHLRRPRTAHHKLAKRP